MLTPPQQTARQLQWFARHGVERLDLAVQPRSGTWLAPHQNLDAARLGKLLPWCRAENADGSNVYVRPHRHSDVPVVFLDDVTVSAAMTLAQMHPALVLETSANRCHVWIVVDRLLRESERFSTTSDACRKARGRQTARRPGVDQRRPLREAMRLPKSQGRQRLLGKPPRRCRLRCGARGRRLNKADVRNRHAKGVCDLRTRRRTSPYFMFE